MKAAAALTDDLLLRIDHAGNSAIVAAGDGVVPTVSLTTLLRDEFAALDGARREHIFTSTAAVAAELKTRHPNRLAESLMQIREALRERHPTSEQVKGSARGLRAAGVLTLDDESFYLHGWSYDAESELDSL